MGEKSPEREDAMAEKVIQIARYKHPLPAWFPALQFIAFHRAKPLEFFSQLAAALGVDEQEPVINFATALSRRYGLNVGELAALFKTIAALTGQTGETCHRAVSRLGVEENQRDALLMCTTLERAASAAEFSWERDAIFGARCAAARDGCRAWLSGIRPPSGRQAWRPTEELMLLIAVLIEAVRLEAGGQAIDRRESRWQAQA